MTDTSKQLRQHKHCCERIYYAIAEGRDALAVKVLQDELAIARAEVLTTMIERVEKQKWNYHIAKDMNRKYVLALDDVLTLLRDELTKKE